MAGVWDPRSSFHQPPALEPSDVRRTLVRSREGMNTPSCRRQSRKLDHRHIYSDYSKNSSSQASDQPHRVTTVKFVNYLPTFTASPILPVCFIECLLQICIRRTISTSMLSSFTRDASLSVTFLTGADPASFAYSIWGDQSIARSFVAVCHISSSLCISLSSPGPELLDYSFTQNSSDRLKSNRLVAACGWESFPRR
jgi:hypothetical protein